MTAAIYDFPAIAKLTKAFAEEPPQNEVRPVETESPAYSYSSGDLGHVYGYDADAQPFPADYSCWAREWDAHRCAASGAFYYSPMWLPNTMPRLGSGQGVGG